MSDSGNMKLYKKSSGFACMHGELYEIHVIMLLFVRSMFQTESFKLASNLQDAGIFDDVVLWFKDKETKEEKTYLIEIKNKIRKSFIDKRSLCALKGDFGLFKYFESYLKIKENFSCGTNMFVIYTNLQMKTTTSCISNEANDLLSSGGRIFTFTQGSEEYGALKQIIAEEQTEEWKLEEFDEFMRSLKLYTEQSRVEDLESLVKHDLENFCGTSSMFSELRNEIMTWWRGSNIYLTEKALFWENILQHHASELMNTISSKYSPVSCLKFQQTQEMKLNKKVTHIICQGSTELCCLKVRQNLSNVKHLLIDKSVLQVHLREVLFLWNHFHILIVDGSSSQVETEIISQLSNILRMEQDKKIIFISDNTDLMAIKFSKLFPSKSYMEIFNIGELTVESQDIIMNYEVQFQGIYVKMKQIVSDQDFMTSDVTIELMKNGKSFEIGCQLPSIDNIYIPRTLQRKETISKKIFESIESGVIAISGITLSEMTSLFPEKTAMQEFTDGVKINIKCRHFIIDGNTSFRNLCEKFEQVHWLEKKGESFVWKNSKGDITLVKNNLEQNKDSIQYNSTCQVLETPEQIKLLIAAPGMGKTVEVAHLAREWKEKNPSTWVVVVNLNDHINTLAPRDTLNAVDLLCGAGNLKTMFERSLFEHELFHGGNILIILDGFDEVSPEYSEKVIAIVNEITCTKASNICVTSRSFMQNKLEKEFSTLAFSLNKLSHENQKTLLEKTWHMLGIKSADAREFSHILLNSYAKLSNKASGDFTGTPLHCRMLSEIFKNEVQMYSASGNSYALANLDMLELYEKVVNLKFEIYLHKYNLGLASFTGYSMAQEMKKTWLKDMALCALVTFLNEDNFADLSNSRELKNSYHNIVDRFEQGIDKTGLILTIVQDQPVFVHRSFAEYFVALWLSENFRENRKLILNKLFDSDWQIVKSFLDRILCVGSKLHTAILHHDFAAVQLQLDSQEGIVNKRDKGGRTPLHIAVTSWNKEHYDSCKTILVMLLDRMANPNIKDYLCNWRPLRLAENMKLWFAVEILLDRGAHKRDLVNIKNSFQDREYIEDLIKSSLTGGLNNILQFLLASGDDEVMNLLIYYGADLTAIDSDGNSLLHYAAKHGDVHTVSKLLDHKVDINATNKKIQTAAHIAIKHNKMETVKLLLERNINSKVCDVNGNTLLHYAAESGDELIVQLLIKHGACVNIWNKYTQTPIHLAVIHNRYQIVKLLLCHGADISTHDIDGNTSLHYAAEHGDVSIVNLLINHGANVNIKNYQMQIPMHFAVRHGRWQIVKELLGHGADISYCDGDGNTLLHYAVERGDMSIVQLLIKHGANVNVKNMQGQTPIHLAIKFDNCQIVELLLYDADISTCDIDGNTLLHYAVERGDMSIVQLLIKHGANVNVKNMQGQTPIHLAIKFDNCKIVELLLYDADISTCDIDGNTLLHYAAKCDDKDILKLLLKHGADVNITNNDMQTPTQLAVKHDKLKNVKLLQRYGARTSQRDKFEMNVVDYAVKHDSKPVQKLLKKKGI